MKKIGFKYPTMPRQIIKKGKGFYNTYTGVWLSDTELKRYSTEPQQNEQKNKHSLSHEQILSKRWDLNRD